MALVKRESPSRLLSKCWKVQWNDNHKDGWLKLPPPPLFSIIFVGTAWHSSKLKRKWVGVSANQIVSTACKSWIRNSTSSSSSPCLVFVVVVVVGWGRALIFGDTVTIGRWCWCHFDIDSGRRAYWSSLYCFSPLAPSSPIWLPCPSPPSALLTLQDPPSPPRWLLLGWSVISSELKSNGHFLVLMWLEFSTNRQDWLFSS